jgi:flavin reductase (DIM6/NTAB) family NADH-FMN oxidoreductase RutF
MTDNVHFYSPTDGHGLAHDPFKAIIAPRMIGWISSRDAAGRVNLAPYSFFNAFASSPSIIGFSSEGYKDTVRNIEETGEFVWNLASHALAGQMNQSSAPVPSDVNEFELSGLTAGKGRNVGVPHVLESPAALECKLLQVQRLKSLDGAEIENWLVLGQVVGVHIRREFIKDGRFDTFAAQPIMRAGYAREYASIGPKFEMTRPNF